MSASTSDPSGPGSSRVRSRTRTPSSARIRRSLREIEELLQLHGEHLVALHLELAGEEKLHAVRLRVLHELLEVGVAHGDGALGVRGLAGLRRGAGRRGG